MKTFPVISPPFGFVLVIISSYFWTISAGLATETRLNWATEAYQKNCPSVVFIQGDKVEERRGSAADAERIFNGMGSGIIIDERGYILTNSHVVRDIRKIQVKTHDKKEYTAAIVGNDEDTDLAIIKIDVRSPLRPIVFGRSHDLLPGEVCMAIGNPYGYDFSLTDGRISAVKREVGVNDTTLVYRDSIQTNTEINPGNSGGPLINVDGELIGINVCMRSGATGIAFAIPVDQVVEVAAKLIGEIVNRKNTLGLTVSQNEPKDFNAIKRFVIRVESVESNSPAAKAGIQKGDILTGIGQYTLRNQLDFYRALLDLKESEEVAFTFFRNNELLDTAVVMGAPKGRAFAQRTASPQTTSPQTVAPQTVAPQPAAAAPQTTANVGPKNEKTGAKAADWDKLIWDNLGIQYAPIPAQEFERTYGNFLDQFEGGIVVKAVRKDSPAERAALDVGDVITAIDPWAMTAANDIRYVGVQEWERLKSKGEDLSVDVIRDNVHYKTKVSTK
jgi:serine protease Do